MDGTLRVQIGDLPQAWTEATWVVLSATQEGFHRGEYLSAATADADGVCTLGFPSDQPTGFVYAVLDLERDGLDPGDLSFPLDRLPRDLEDGDEDAFSFDALTLLAARSEKEGLPPALDALVAPAPFLFWLYLPLLPFLLWWLRRRIGAMQLPAKVQESPTRPRRAFEPWTGLVLGLACLACLLPRLGDPLTFEEYQALSSLGPFHPHVGSGGVHLPELLFNREDILSTNPPLYTWLLGLLSLVSCAPAFLRLPSLLAAAGTLALSYRLARRLGGVAAAHLALLLVASSAWFASYAVQARRYALATFLSVLALDLLLRYLVRPRERTLRRYLATMVLLFFMHYLGLVLIGAHALTILVACSWARSWRGIPRLLRVGLVAWAPVIFWLPLMLLNYRFSGRFMQLVGYWFREAPGLATHLEGALGAVTGLGPSPWRPLLLALAVGVWALALYQLRRRDVLGAVVLSITPAVVLVLLAVHYLFMVDNLGGRADANYRYALPLIPLFAVALACWVTAWLLDSAASPVKRVAVAAVALALWLPGLPVSLATYLVPQAPDQPRAADWIRDNAQDGDALVAFPFFRYGQQFGYYLGGERAERLWYEVPPRHWFELTTGHGTVAFREPLLYVFLPPQLMARSLAVRRLWVVSYREVEHGRERFDALAIERFYLERLDEAFELVERWEFRDLSLVLLERREPAGAVDGLPLDLDLGDPVTALEHVVGLDGSSFPPEVHPDATVEVLLGGVAEAFGARTPSSGLLVALEIDASERVGEGPKTSPGACLVVVDGDGREATLVDFDDRRARFAVDLPQEEDGLVPLSVESRCVYPVALRRLVVSRRD